MSETKALLEQARKRIQEKIEKAEEDRKRKFQALRIDIAKSGLIAYDDRRISEAARQFLTYLSILEESKGVGTHGLMPSHFDRTKDMAEMLLISGVYWDLTKLYDRTTSVESQKNFRVFLEKFVLFSKGMPYQPVCAETMRKYIVASKAIHKDQFKQAYRQLSDGKCFIATALEDDLAAHTAWRLRLFRDEVLSKSLLGRLIIRIYYRVGPLFSRLIPVLPHSLRKQMARSLDRLAVLFEQLSGA